MGRWITRDRARTEAPRILEFKVQVDAADLPLENPDGTPRDSGYPKRKIELRVFCCFSEDDSTIVLFDGHDKGEDPNGQEAAIEGGLHSPERLPWPRRTARAKPPRGRPELHPGRKAADTPLAVI